MPPATIATNSAWQPASHRAHATPRAGSAARQDAKKMPRTPMWNRFEPHCSCLRRSSCELSLFQVYCSRSKRIRLPTKNTVRARTVEPEQELIYIAGNIHRRSPVTRPSYHKPHTPALYGSFVSLARK